jgi:hypothetical protein
MQCAQSSMAWKIFYRKVFLWTRKERYATKKISSCGIVSPKNISPLLCYVTKDQSHSLFMEPMDLEIFVHDCSKKWRTVRPLMPHLEAVDIMLQNCLHQNTVVN